MAVGDGDDDGDGERDGDGDDDGEGEQAVKFIATARMRLL